MNIEFIVQIGVWGENTDNSTQDLINSIGKSEKILDKGKLYKYIAGRYNSLSEAESRKDEVVNKGFEDAFIYALKDGKRITISEALRLLNN